MNIAFRVDASGQIGTGHFMRCLTLADALHKRGAKIRFISRNLPEYLREMLLIRGHQFAELPGALIVPPHSGLAHAHWLASDQNTDAQGSIDALSDQSWDWLVVDHYALDVTWESRLRSAVHKIFVIDDIADRRHDCDVLLDQNFYADMHTRYLGKVPAGCKLMLGPRFALLREEFYTFRQQLKPRRGVPRRILVFFGGVDADNHTLQAIRALTEMEFADLQVDVVVGELHPYLGRVEDACVEFGFTCHVQTKSMARLLAEADLAIGAGGTAVWERCCLGIPTLTICTAANQIRQVADAANGGLLLGLEGDGDIKDSIVRYLRVFLRNTALNQLVSRNAMLAVDGHGISRVIGNLDCTNVEIRMATAGDSAQIFEWRNHHRIRSASRDPKLILRSTHELWFSTLLASTEHVLLIGERNNSALGVVRFDIQKAVAEVSIYLVQESNEWGSGQDLLKSAERWLARNRSDVHELRADVLRSNERSHRLFLGANYEVESTTYSKRLR